MNKEKIIDVIIGMLFVIIVVLGIILFIKKMNIKEFSESTEIIDQNIIINETNQEIEDNEKESEPNYFEIQGMTDEQMAEYYLFRYKDDIIYNPKELYNKLDQTYKEKKFRNLEEFTSYINENKKILADIKLSKYKVNKYDDHTEYICLDQYGNYYIFKETAVMNYTVQLDTYTIDSEEFLNKYNNGEDQLKVGMNLEKIFQALNRKDYEYIYEKLNKEFRTNNFPTLEEFKKYIEENFFNINNVSYGNFESKSGSYIYELNITDATEEDEYTIEKNFIVKLGEGTDFEIAFNK